MFASKVHLFSIAVSFFVIICFFVWSNCLEALFLTQKNQEVEGALQ